MLLPYTECFIIQIFIHLSIAGKFFPTVDSEYLRLFRAEIQGRIQLL